MRQSIDLTRDPQDLRDAFARLLEPRSVAILLDVTYEALVYYLYRSGDRKYRKFDIARRAGGTRPIAEPMPGLKIIQHKLVQVLSAVYRPRPSVHGFTADRSVATNAQLHEGSQFVLNLDLKDFFQTINFGRVRGLFIAAPYNLPPPVATVLAQICCHENALPQGAPSSPIISNMIAARLDSQMQRLARRHRCLYSRYADDITLSTRRDRFPRYLAYVEPDAARTDVTLGKPLEQVITSNGFEINYQKVRLRSRTERQEVTGLIVNQEANVRRTFVRQVRAMLHAWRKYGYDAAAAEYSKRYGIRKNRSPVKEPPTFRQVIKGKIDFIGMVKGKDHRVYQNLLLQYLALAEKPRRPAHRERPNHLRRFKDGLWVLQCEETGSQGTAFFLKGIGVVTCEHVLAASTKAVRPDRPSLRYDVQILARDRTLDLAILKLVGADGFEFEPLVGREAETGDTISIAAFPNWNPGTTLWQDTGRIAGRHSYFGIWCYRVTCPIVFGASGAPVFDGYRRVVGVAARGADTVESGRETAEHGVIPIGRVVELAHAAGLLPKS